jgi:hypothetical protein
MIMKIIAALLILIPSIALAQHATISMDYVLEQYLYETELCRGGIGDKLETWEHCGRRLAYRDIIIHAGYCFPAEGKIRLVKGNPTAKADCQ